MEENENIVTSLKIGLEVLRRDVEGINGSLRDIKDNLKSVSTIEMTVIELKHKTLSHETRISSLEHSHKELLNRIQKSKDDIITELSSIKKATREERKEEIETINKRLKVIEQWRIWILGAGAVIIWLLSKTPLSSILSIF